MLLLAQASDWAFMMSARTSVEYAERRTRDHLANFDDLFQQITEDRINEHHLANLESRNNIFAELGYDVFRG